MLLVKMVLAFVIRPIHSSENSLSVHLRVLPLTFVELAV